MTDDNVKKDAAQPEPNPSEGTAAEAEAKSAPETANEATKAETPEPSATANEPAAPAKPEQAAAPAEPAKEADAPAAASAQSAGSDGAADAAKAVTDPEREEKIRRAAEARAARAAARGEGAPAGGAGAEAAPERPARAPRAPRNAEGGEGEPEKPKEPSRNQPLLDRIVAVLNEFVGPDAIEKAEINEKSGEIPTLTVKADRWFQAAEMLKLNPELSMNYLRNVSGVDQETHLEVVYHFISLTSKKEVCVKVKTERDAPSVPSVTPLWATADWPEREIYDLLGIDFPGHPDLKRIMLPDDWVGHPLRKDYEPLDPEV